MAQINPDDELYRRLAPSHIRDNGTVNSAAFKLSDVYETEISVDIAKLTDPQTSVNRAGRAGFRLAAVQSKHPVELGFRIVPDPVPGNDAHPLLMGRNDKRISRVLAAKCRVVPGVVSSAPSGFDEDKSGDR